MKNLVRRVIERFLLRYDYRIVDVLSDPPGLACACERLKAKGFMPRTVIDVGVGRGTPWLYEAFPTARFELFEAQSSFAPLVEQVTRGLDARVEYCALGAERMTATIRVEQDRPTSASMAGLTEEYLSAGDNDGSCRHMFEQTVQVRRLDEFGPFEGPVLLKLDVEGFEAEVLKGATRVLDAVDVIISEVSVARRARDELSLAGYLGLLESLGFSMVNIAEIAQIGRGGPVAYMDLVFVRSDSTLRYGKSWSLRSRQPRQPSVAGD